MGEDTGKMRKIGVVTQTIREFRQYCDKNDLTQKNYCCGESKDGESLYFHVSTVERSRGSEFHDIVVYGSGNELPYSTIQYFQSRVRLT